MVVTFIRYAFTLVIEQSTHQHTHTWGMLVHTTGQQIDDRIEIINKQKTGWCVDCYKRSGATLLTENKNSIIKKKIRIARKCMQIYVDESFGVYVCVSVIELVLLCGFACVCVCVMSRKSYHLQNVSVWVCEICFYIDCKILHPITIKREDPKTLRE